VFGRFSTVAGEKGSADTVRDVRGFALKFYTGVGSLKKVPRRIQETMVGHFFLEDRHCQIRRLD